MVSDVAAFGVVVAEARLNPCSNGIWSLTIEKDEVNSCLSGLNPCSNGIWSLTASHASRLTPHASRLNPCSNGIWSLTHVTLTVTTAEGGLNPCSNGIWSLTLSVTSLANTPEQVLILVLMEYGL